MNVTSYSPMSGTDFAMHVATATALIGLWYWCLCSASDMNNGRYDHVPWIFRPIARCEICHKKQRGRATREPIPLEQLNSA